MMAGGETAIQGWNELIMQMNARNSDNENFSEEGR